MTVLHPHPDPDHSERVRARFKVPVTEARLRWVSLKDRGDKEITEYGFTTLGMFSVH